MSTYQTLSGTYLGSLCNLNTGRSFSGAQLETEIARRAHALGTHLRPTARIALVANSDAAEALIDLLALWRAGGCAAMLNPGLTAHELRAIVDAVKPALIMGGVHETIFPGVQTLGADYATDQEIDGQGAAHPYGLDDPALILFTSGTSGAPKGVVLSHRAIEARIALNIAQISAETLAHSLNLLPVHFGHGLLGNCLTPLFAGGTLNLLPDAGIAGAAALGTIIDTNDISFMSSVPGMWKLALRMSEPPKNNSLKRVHIGSAPLSAGLWRDIADWAGAPVWNMYGTTETANWAAGTDQIGDGQIGRMWGGQSRIRTEAGHWAQTGEGELFVRTPSLMSGYFNRPDLTGDVVQSGWYATGDIVERGADGDMRLLGRNRYMINVDGMKVYPEELDLLFEQHSQISDVCAFAMPDAAGGEQVALAYVSDSEINHDTLRRWAAERLRPDAIPRIFTQLETLPRTDRGKLNRDIVRDAVIALAK